MVALLRSRPLTRHSVVNPFVLGSNAGKTTRVCTVAAGPPVWVENRGLGGGPFHTRPTVFYRLVFCYAFSGPSLPKAIGPKRVEATRSARGRERRNKQLVFDQWLERKCLLVDIERPVSHEGWLGS